ncbi:MAG TPA: winged helix-turn-helix domain-containing protein [Terriglobales bacterium]|nr:winged helix-turn-helix domain-containing protein [Terriglobales bacterium]
MASQPVRPRSSIRFGDFDLDCRTRQLRRGGRVLKLERIPVEVLLLLVEQSGEVVTREQIADRIWGKDVFLDTDNSINGAIRKIRQALKDDPEQPRFIQTVTGQGYRFIAPISGPDEPQQAPTVLPVVVSQETPPVRRRMPWKWAAGIAIVIVLAILPTAYWHWSRTRASVQPAAARVMLAVLPFENLTGDATQDYFSDGMTEEMITYLGNLDPQHLGVIARTSVMTYKRNPKPLDQVGRELGVQYALEGSIRRDSDRVRVSAQLIQLKDQTHLWAREYDREAKDVLLLQSDIAREIAREIAASLGERKPVEPIVPPSLSSEQYEAYNLYLKGQYFFAKRTIPGFEQAIGYFEQAIAKDPNYARAYAGIADCYALIGGYSIRPQSEFIPKARAAALRAVELDPNLAEAHTALALIVQNYDWNWAEAEKEFQRAIELNPNYATAHHWYSEHLGYRGRFEEAFRESERARQLDPLSLIIAADRAVLLYYDRQYDRAIAEFKAVQEMDPIFPRAGVILNAYVEKGMYSEAIALVEKKPYPQFPWYWSVCAYVYGRAGQTEKAEYAIVQLRRLQEQNPGSIEPAAMVSAYVAVGDKDQAFAWLEQAYRQHSIAITTLKVEPGLDSLRGDPRFQDLLRRVGLAD